MIVYVQALDGMNQEKPFAICFAAKLGFRQNFSLFMNFQIIAFLSRRVFKKAPRAILRGIGVLDLSAVYGVVSAKK